MKVLLINGSPHAKGSTYTALHEMEKVFTENGIEAEIAAGRYNTISKEGKTCNGRLPNEDRENSD